MSQVKKFEAYLNVDKRKYEELEEKYKNFKEKDFMGKVFEKDYYFDDYKDRLSSSLSYFIGITSYHPRIFYSVLEYLPNIIKEIENRNISLHEAAYLMYKYWKENK